MFADSAMRGTRVPAIVSSDFRPGTEVVGRLALSCTRTSTTTSNRELAPVRTALGGRAGLLPMPTAAPARYRRVSTRGAPPAAHCGSPSRSLTASGDAGAVTSLRVRLCRSSEPGGAPRQAGVSGHDERPSTCQRCALTNCSNVRVSAAGNKQHLCPSSPARDTSA
jgi:hypothetical protein